MNFSIVQNYPLLSRLQLLLEFENDRNNELDCTTELWLPVCNSFEIKVRHTRTIRVPDSGIHGPKPVGTGPGPKK